MTPWSTCAGMVALENDIDVGGYDSGWGSLLSWKITGVRYHMLLERSGNIKYFGFKFAPLSWPGELTLNTIRRSCGTTNSSVGASRKVYV